MARFKTFGFTAVELMVVIAIVAILISLAYPSWRESVRKARRSDAMQSLMDLRMKQSQWRANHTIYATSLASLGYGGGTSIDGHYTITFVGTPNATTFVAIATPAGQQSGESCGTFAVDQDGMNTTGSYANPSCWNQ